MDIICCAICIIAGLFMSDPRSEERREEWKEVSVGRVTFVG